MATKETVVKLDNGLQLCCPAYPANVDYVRIESDRGMELGYYSIEEFKEDATGTLGALIGLMRHGNGRGR